MDILYVLSNQIPAEEANILALIQHRDQKLWFQATAVVLQLLRSPHIRAHGSLRPLFDLAVAALVDKINPTQYAVAVSIVALSLPDPAASLQLVSTEEERIATLPLGKGHEGVLVCQSYRALFLARTQKTREARELLNSVKSKIDHLTFKPADLSAAFHFSEAGLFKELNDLSGFVGAAIRYLGFVRVEEVLLIDQQRALAYDLAIGALIGDSIYSFGEIVRQSVFASLTGTEFAWLADLLHAFHTGNLTAFKNLGPSISSLPILGQNISLLTEKIRIMTLVSVVFEKDPRDRHIPIADLSAALQSSSVDEVEKIVMKAFSLGLLKGVIDQVDSVVQFTWVIPRILDEAQIQVMATKFSGWKDRVKESQVKIQSESEAVFH